MNYLCLLFDGNSGYTNQYSPHSNLFSQIEKTKVAISLANRSDTDFQLHFQDIEYGISSSKLVSLIGKPKTYDLISLGEEKVVRLDFNIASKSVVNKHVYYFRNDKYFMGKFQFNKIEEGLQNEIVDSINTKYKTSYLGNESFGISNVSGDYLNYVDIGFKIEVSYFNRDSEDINCLLNYLDEYKSKIRDDIFTNQISYS